MQYFAPFLRVLLVAAGSCLTLCSAVGCSGDDDGKTTVNPKDKDGGGPRDTMGDGGEDENNTNTGADSGKGCDGTLNLTVRDFTEAHPDFQAYLGSLKGIVREDLGSDKKPVYAPSGATKVTTGADAFNQWYRDVPGVNVRVPVSITFKDDGTGLFVYDNSSFFPVDGVGLGNGPGSSPHNYLFTTEAHTLFTYRGGEVFSFRGDDDLFIFINNKLAIDLGGVHVVETQTIRLDEVAQRLGIEVGRTYSMDIFHAERHTSESNFRIETTIDLSCVENVVVL